MQNIKSPIVFETAYGIYTADAIIGQGGAGRVYAALDEEKFPVAVKLLNSDQPSTDKRKRFKNELAFLHKTSHKHLVPVLDHGVSNLKGSSGPFYVMPRYDGSLRELISKGIPPNEVIQIFDQLLQGVEAAHLLGVVHRDLKPENVLYKRDKQQITLAIADFGVARFQPEDQETLVETSVSTRLANFTYASPEQRIKGVTVDHRTDIFSLGLIFNEMFTNSVLQGVGYKTVSSIAPDLSYVDSIVEMMVQQAPSSRYQNIEQVKAELVVKGNAFIAFQKLEGKRKEVVLSSAPDKVEEVKIKAVDWNQERLSIELDRVPEIGWVQRFKNPRGSWGSVMGSGPEHFNFQGNIASVGASQNSAQEIINNFKNYLRMATVAYQEDLAEESKREEHNRREKLANEIKTAEIRSKVVNGLSF